MLLQTLTKEVTTIGRKIRDNLNLGMGCKLRIDIENIWATMVIQAKKKYYGYPLVDKQFWINSVYLKLIKGQDPEVICEVKRHAKYTIKYKGMEATRADYPLISKKILEKFYQYILQEIRSDESNQIINSSFLQAQIKPFVANLKGLISHVWDKLSFEDRIKIFAFSRKK